MTQNEKKYIETIFELDQRVNEARQYIKNVYNVDTEYNESELKFIQHNVNESLNISMAKEYMTNKFEDFITIL